MSDLCDGAFPPPCTPACRGVWLQSGCTSAEPYLYDCISQHTTEVRDKWVELCGCGILKLVVPKREIWWTQCISCPANGMLYWHTILHTCAPNQCSHGNVRLARNRLYPTPSEEITVFQMKGRIS